ncbi:lipase member I-like [Asterias rubens]|uniref:lipase member I-like n=1 Tax=Asterias rubens TaxID=7604 RepID=UPI0014557671|nr:lipase member I-like [Asterias rubens]
MKTLKDKLLDTEDFNVFLVDWANGARNLYGKSVQNTRVVGRVIGRTMQFLNTETGAQFDRMHLIGHSLGAHISGYAGAFQPGVGRISGLDPAGPNFSLNDPLCRLDPTDAIFVDVIHSDAELVGAGIVQAVGHVDFYPNGGKEQPGCPPSLRDAFMNSGKPSCSHMRVLDLYIDSFDETQCAPMGYPCASWDAFQSGTCSSSCGVFNRLCPKMGYWADLALSTGVFYLATGSESPYCKV